MKKSGIIVVSLLLLAIPAAFSQAFRIDVDNKPLSKVLNTLGVEISFDERALSAYAISLSESFEDREAALFRLLENKPFRIEKTGSVYVIVPAGEGRTAGRVATSVPEKQLTFKGTVIDQSTREALEYTTVSLLHPGGEPFLAGITTGGGRFSFETTVRPEKLKISYLGYETLLADIRDRQGELGVFTLKEKAVPLGETVVTADWDKPTRINYSVSPQMYNGVDNAMELLNRIPGIRFDDYSKAVMVNNRTNVLLLVDGIQYPQAYLWHLSPRRVHAIEVMQASSGRFVSDDYVAIVNFMLNRNYTGYDVNVSDISSLNLSESNGYSRRTEDRPAAGITYATRKWNFFGTYSYEREKRNLFSSKELVYGNSILASVPPEHPNNLYESGSNTLSGGANYRITPRHLAGIQGDYAQGDVYTRQAYTLRRTDLSTNRNRILTNTTEDRTKAYTFAGSVFYQGQVTDRLRLYGGFSYNYYYNLIANEYRQGETANYRYENFYNEYKNQTVLNVEGKYVLSDRLSAEAGYSNIRRRYASTSNKGIGFLDYSEQRNKAYAYLLYNPSDKTGLKAGAAVERIHTRNRETPGNYIRLLPFFQASYMITPGVHILAGYAASQSYPSLYQLSPMSATIDTFLTQIGNPALNPAVRHQAFAELTLWGQWRIVPQFNFVRQGISEVYEIKEYKLYRTFDNINTREYSIQAAYDRMFGYFRLKNAVTLYHSEAFHRRVHNSLNGWLFLSEVNWYHPGAAFGVQLGYYRDMKKNILWQGYQMSGRDYWRLSVQKELWRERISLMLSYIPPVAFGVRYNRVKEMDTPLYGEKTILRLDSYNQMLLLKISIRFERGGASPAGKPSITGNEERER
ncbi:MAG: outer membrane beta-barrel protein [Tannerellaceae bacterium]|nr:outer membrane beta-barrel protein [Tannerellaceae bacterium]